jgi:hypothetical protein
MLKSLASASMQNIIIYNDKIAQNPENQKNLENLRYGLAE